MQTSWRSGQRGWKWQPGGGSSALAISPVAFWEVQGLRRNGSGIAAISARV